MKLSVNPLYQCNFDCSFCYLTKEQLRSKNRLCLQKLRELLKEVSEYKEITSLDLYGGEIALLSSEYLYELAEIIYDFYKDQINIISNLSKIHPFFLENYNDLSVSYDHDCRQGHDLVFNNILRLDKNISILMLASKEMITWSDKKLDHIIQRFNQVSNIKSVEIKPYSSNQANQLAVSFVDYENFVQRWIDRKNEFNFNFINYEKIISSLEKKSSSWSDDHLYITPHGKLGVLEFDTKGNEHFLELESIETYQAWCLKEKEMINANEYCSRCNYLGHCLSEHLQFVPNLNNSCNGFKNLLDRHA